MYNVKFIYNFFSVRGFLIYFLGLTSLFLFLSFISFYSKDPSFFYVSNEIEPVYNMCGFLGAHCASFFFYCFGSASFLFIFLLLYSVYLLTYTGSIKQEWERFLCSIYLIVVVAGIFSLYNVDFFYPYCPGGLLGVSFFQNVVHVFDFLGGTLFLHVSFVACLIVLFRFSYVWMIQYCRYAVMYVVQLMKQYKVVYHFFNIIYITVYTITIKPCIYFITFMQSLFNGSAFDSTGLIVPEEEQKNIFLDEVCTDDQFCNNSITTSQESFVCAETYENNVLIDDEEKHVKEINGELNLYVLPHLDIFVADKNIYGDYDIEKELEMHAIILQDKLKRFGIAGEVVAIKRGPVVTLFEYKPDIDIKISKITSFEDDLAMALQAMSVRIIAPIPGKSVVGFEVANNKRQEVLFSQLVHSSLYKNFSGMLPLILGKGTIGEIVVVDLARMPHLLIAGSTGSGKSVALNAILISLLCKLNPDQLKLILIDPKRLEFASFADIAHLLFPIVTSAYRAAPVLKWVIQEMEDRYEKMATYGARNIEDYNKRIVVDDSMNKLPSIVVIIDELADLMITVGRDIEDYITRITQMARAAGIHMIVATQRPSVDVITGLIKANFPSRISFRVASRIDSRTILDTVGADRLLGRGDMLFLDASTSQLNRVHGAYVSDDEINTIVMHIKSQRTVEYLDINEEVQRKNDVDPADDLLYKDVCRFLNEIDEISISLLQRKFRIGYNRSARIIDILESQGLIMPQDGSKTRKVIR